LSTHYVHEIAVFARIFARPRPLIRAMDATPKRRRVSESPEVPAGLPGVAAGSELDAAQLRALVRACRDQRDFESAAWYARKLVVLTAARDDACCLAECLLDNGEPGRAVRALESGGYLDVAMEPPSGVDGFRMAPGRLRPVLIACLALRALALWDRWEPQGGGSGEGGCTAACTALQASPLRRPSMCPSVAARAGCHCPPNSPHLGVWSLSRLLPSPPRPPPFITTRAPTAGFTVLLPCSWRVRGVG
jgi:hypothetical protein